MIIVSNPIHSRVSNLNKRVRSTTHRPVPHTELRIQSRGDESGVVVQTSKLRLLNRPADLPALFCVVLCCSCTSTWRSKRWPAGTGSRSTGPRSCSSTGAATLLPGSLSLHICWCPHWSRQHISRGRVGVCRPPLITIRTTDACCTAPSPTDGATPCSCVRYFQRRAGGAPVRVRRGAVPAVRPGEGRRNLRGLRPHQVTRRGGEPGVDLRPHALKARETPDGWRGIEMPGEETGSSGRDGIGRHRSRSRRGPAPSQRAAAICCGRCGRVHAVRPVCSRWRYVWHPSCRQHHPGQEAALVGLRSGWGMTGEQGR